MNIRTFSGALLLCILGTIEMVGAAGIDVHLIGNDSVFVHEDGISLGWKSHAGRPEDSVTLQLYRETEYERTILSSAPADGKTVWDIPEDLDTRYYYRIKVMRISDHDVYGYSRNFRVRNLEAVTIIRPTYGDTLLVGRTDAILWDPSGSAVDSVTIELLRNRRYESTIAVSTINHGKFAWTPSDTLDLLSEYSIRIHGAGPNTKLLGVGNPFYLKKQYRIDIGRPNQNDTIFPGIPDTIRWKSAGVQSPVKISLYYFDNEHEILSHSTQNTGSFIWTKSWEPYRGGYGYRIKISEVGNPEVGEFSQPFVISPLPTTQVVTPKAGDVWTGTHARVEWTSSNLWSRYVTILLYNSDKLVTVLADSVLDNGSQTVVIPRDIDSGGGYSVCVVSDPLQSPLYGYSKEFTIAPNPSGNIVTTPKAGSIQQPGTETTIAWNTAAFSGSDVTISLYRGSSLLPRTSVRVLNKGVYEQYHLPAGIPESDTYRILVEDKRTSHFSDYFQVKDQSIFRLTAPKPGIVLKSGDKTKISWSIKGYPRKRAVLSYSLAFHSFWTVIDTVDAYGGTYEWTLPQTNSKMECRLRIGPDYRSSAGDTVVVTIVPGDAPVVPVPICTPTTEDSLRMAWHSTGDKEYFLQISSTPEFPDAKSRTVADTQLVMPWFFGHSVIYWRVRPATSLRSDWSEPCRTAIQFPGIPVPIPVRPDPTPDRRPVLSWNPVEDASHYRLVVADNSKFSDPLVSIPTTETKFQTAVDFPLGTIYWKVKSDLSSRYSPVQEFRIVPDTIPVLERFYGDTAETAKPTFRWRKVSRAKEYRIEVFSKDTTHGGPLLVLNISDTKFTPFVSLKEGLHFWRVSSDLDFRAYSSFDSLVIPENVATVREIQAPRHSSVRTAMQKGVGPVLKYATVQGGTVELELFDARGTRINKIQRSHSSAGYYEMPLMNNNPTAGMYLCVLRMDGKVFKEKIVVAR